MSRAELIEAAARAICSDGKPFKWGRLAPDSQRKYLEWAERALDAILAGLGQNELVMRENGEKVHEVRGAPNDVWQAMLATIAKE